MDIVSIEYEKPLLIRIGDNTVKILAFRTLEPGNIKFGVDAPRAVHVHREEIFHAIKQKEQQENPE